MIGDASLVIAAWLAVGLVLSGCDTALTPAPFQPACLIFCRVEYGPADVSAPLATTVTATQEFAGGGGGSVSSGDRYQNDGVAQ